MIDPKQMVFPFLQEDPAYQQERQTSLIVKQLLPKLASLLDRKSEQIIERMMGDRLVNERDLLQEVTTRLERIEARLTSYDRALRSLQSQVELDDADWWKRGPDNDADCDEADINKASNSSAKPASWDDWESITDESRSAKDEDADPPF